MNRSPAKKNARGAFLNGIWHCECEPSLPAEHFQTKNGGQNHGRWCKTPNLIISVLQLIERNLVYTCQKSQPKRCKFFMWDDEAKVREESAVLNNSRSEIAPHTPTKSVAAAPQLMSPHVSLAQETRCEILTSKQEQNAACEQR